MEQSCLCLLPQGIKDMLWCNDFQAGTFVKSRQMLSCWQPPGVPMH